MTHLICRETNIRPRFLLVAFFSVLLLLVGFSSNAYAGGGDASSTSPSWGGDAGEEVNTYTGELYYTTTDLSLPTRGGIGLSLSRSYTSALYNQWDDSSEADETCAGVPIGGRNYKSEVYSSAHQGFGPGWRFGWGAFYPGDIQDTLYPTNPVLTRADGSTEYSVVGLGYQSDRYVFGDDSWVYKDSLLASDPQSHTVFHASGGRTVYKKNAATQFLPQTIYAGVGINDAHDGKIDFTYVIATTLIDKITDQDGRTITLNYTFPKVELYQHSDDSVRIVSAEYKNWNDSAIHTSYFYDATTGWLAGVVTPWGDTTRYGYTDSLYNTHLRYVDSLCDTINPANYYDNLDDPHLLSSITFPTGGSVDFDYEVWWEQWGEWEINDIIQITGCDSSTLAIYGLDWCRRSPDSCGCTTSWGDTLNIHYKPHFGVRKKTNIDSQGDTAAVTKFERRYSGTVPNHSPGRLISTVTDPIGGKTRYLYDTLLFYSDEDNGMDSRDKGFLQEVQTFSHTDTTDPIFSSTYEWEFTKYGYNKWGWGVGRPVLAVHSKYRGVSDPLLGDCTSDPPADCVLERTESSELLRDDYSMFTYETKYRNWQTAGDEYSVTATNNAIIGGQRVVDSLYTYKQFYTDTAQDSLDTHESFVNYYYDATGVCPFPDSIVTFSDSTANTIFSPVSVQKFEYDDWGNAIKVTNNIGTVTHFTLDTIYHQFITQKGNDSLPVRVVDEFYSNGSIKRTDALNGSWSEFEYDEYDRPLNIYLFPEDSAAAPLYKLPSKYYDYVSPNEVIVYSKLGKTTADATYKSAKMILDDFGRDILTLTTAAGGPTYISETAYDSLGRPYRQSNVYTDSTTNRLWTESSFDKWGNVGRIDHPDGTKNIFERDSLTVTVTIDRAGRKLRSINDINGRLQSIEIDTAYSASDTTSDSARWGFKSTIDLVDANGNIIKKTDHLGLTETRSYRDFDQLAKIVSPDKGERLFYADNMNRARFYRDALGTWTYKRYDALGRHVISGLFDSTSTTGIVPDITKLLDHSYPDTATDSVTITSSTRYDSYDVQWDPDSSSYLASYNLENHALYNQTEVKNDNEYKYYYYDSYGRLEHLIVLLFDNNGDPIDTLHTSTSYRWDGAKDFTVYPTGDTVTYEYDVLGRIKNVGGVSDTGQAFVYNQYGSIAEAHYENGVIRYNTFDTLGILTRTVAEKTINGVKKFYFARDYDWDRYNLISEHTLDTSYQRSDTVGLYIYDYMNRLNSAWVNKEGDTPELQTWDFDENSNWTESERGSATVEYVYYSGTNQLKFKQDGVDSVFYFWNAKGELTSRRTSDATIPSNLSNLSIVIDSMEYDHRGLLVKRITNFGNYDEINILTGAGYKYITTNYYNASGQKVKQLYLNYVKAESCGFFCPYLANYSATYYVYVGGQAIAQYTSVMSSGELDGTSLALFYSPAGLMKSTYRDVSQNKVPRYYHYDYKGSLRRVSGGGAGIPFGSETSYYPYGEFLFQGGFADSKRYYQGAESDYTGFQHMGARYYDPEIGRFITPDPIDASVSSYTFASNNPIMFFDPSGLATSQPGPTRPKAIQPSRVKLRRRSMQSVLIEMRRGHAPEGSVNVVLDYKLRLAVEQYDKRHRSPSSTVQGEAPPTDREIARGIERSQWMENAKNEAFATAASSNKVTKKSKGTDPVIKKTTKNADNADSGTKEEKTKIWGPDDREGPLIKPTREEIKENYQGEALPVHIMLASLDVSEVTMDDFGVDGTANISLLGKDRSSLEDGMVHGNISLELIKGTNLARVQENKELGKQRGGMFDFEMHSTSSSKTVLENIAILGRNIATHIGEEYYGTTGNGWNKRYVGGTPFPIIYHGTIKVPQ